MSIVPSVKELQRIVNKLDGILFDNHVSNVVVTVQSRGKNSSTLGWASIREIWVGEGPDGGTGMYEINLCAECLRSPIEVICEVLVHEMLHVRNAIEEVQDTSRQGRYHNVKFKTQAEEIGLIPKYSKKTGWGVSGGITPELWQVIQKEVKPKTEAFALMRLDIKKEIKETKKIVPYKLQCVKCGLEVTAKEPFKLICEQCSIILDIVSGPEEE